MLTAQFTAATKRHPATLDIVAIVNGQRDYRLIGIKVSGKREARQIAAQHAAKPWNF